MALLAIGCWLEMGDGCWLLGKLLAGDSAGSWLAPGSWLGSLLNAVTIASIIITMELKMTFSR